MGCGNAKGQIINPSSKNNSTPSNDKKQCNNNTNNNEKITENCPPKIKEIKVTAKDFEAIGNKDDMTILDYSNLSMTDLISNGMFLIKAIIGLIEANSSRNQLLKAVLRRMQALEPAFQDLESRNNKLTKEPIVNVIHIVNRIKRFCEKMMVSEKGLWEKFKDAITAKSQLKELADLNELLTKAQTDLQIPMQLETSKKIDNIFNYLKEINERSGEIYAKNEKNINILPLAQKCLKNEEAFIFWLECMPTKYQVTLDKFSSIFSDYIEINKNVKLKPETLNQILYLIRNSKEPLDGKELINAKQVNTFFESLPLEIQWDDPSTFESDAQELLKKREDEIKKLVESQQKNLEEKLKKNESQESDQEKKMVQDKKYIRFISKNSYLEKSKTNKIEINIRNIFINISDGKIHIYGGSKKIGDFIFTGNLNAAGDLNMEMKVGNDESSSVKGKLDVEGSIISSIKINTSQGKFLINLDLDYWFGYYEHEESPSDMRCFLKVIEKNLIGISQDEVGVALWKGNANSSKFEALKYYVNQHSVNYSGNIKKAGTTTKIIGKWEIKEYNMSDKFYLSHNDGGETDEEDNIDETDINKQDSAQFSKCNNGHILKWSNNHDGGYGDTYGCDNCGDQKDVNKGRWNCVIDQFDICGKCRRVPAEATKSCPNGHKLVWSNGVEDSYSYYYCDLCGKEGKNKAGRWNCEACDFDLCHLCRKP